MILDGYNAVPHEASRAVSNAKVVILVETANLIINFSTNKYRQVIER
ncbi:MAG: hypothetical protein ACI97K_001124 [Glaciecola sp.]|jgi:hypothetical protein